MINSLKQKQEKGLVTLFKIIIFHSFDQSKLCFKLYFYQTSRYRIKQGMDRLFKHTHTTSNVAFVTYFVPNFAVSLSRKLLRSTLYGSDRKI